MWWLWVCTTCTGIRDLNIFNRYIVKWLFLVLLYVPYRYYYYYGISYCSIASYKYHSNSSNNEGLVADYCVNDYVSRYNNITNTNSTCNSIMDMEYIDDDHNNNHTNVCNNIYSNTPPIDVWYMNIQNEDTYTNTTEIYIISMMIHLHILIVWAVLLYSSILGTCNIITNNNILKQCMSKRVQANIFLVIAVNTCIALLRTIWFLIYTSCYTWIGM